MKQVALIIAVFCTSCAIAFAGPEPIQSSSHEVKQVVQPVVESCCFDGFYFGVHGGAVIGDSDRYTAVFEESLGAQGNGFASAFDENTSDDSDTSWEFGGHFGYNWVVGCHWLFGIEADVQGSGLEDHQNADAFTGLPSGEFETFIRSRSELNVWATLRPRLGYVFANRFMIFATGGLAAGDAQIKTHSELFAFTNVGGETFAEVDRSDGDWKWGWTVGGGFEICLTRHIILNFTYLYTDLEDSSVSPEFHEISGPVPNGVGFRTYDSFMFSRSDNTFHTVRSGISFKF